MGGFIVTISNNSRSEDMQETLDNLELDQVNSGAETGTTWLDCGGELLQSISPIGGKVIAEVRQAGPDDLDLNSAILLARRSRMPGHCGSTRNPSKPNEKGSRLLLTFVYLCYELMELIVEGSVLGAACFYPLHCAAHCAAVVQPKMLADLRKTLPAIASKQVDRHIPR